MTEKSGCAGCRNTDPSAFEIHSQWPSSRSLNSPITLYGAMRPLCEVSTEKRAYQVLGQVNDQKTAMPLTRLAGSKPSNSLETT